ncbi:A/G-specific DNA-adenine glycosylase [Nitrospirillum amazonense]|uniref:Adenine DNA glycosylase n=1 Tax=Nitrospirillum amazonense TaxID=28077 RepID=A0A560F083_9PROT|nr:A/G-specific adenine glycosylase [Nitrospirillum amazonense]TWB15038.1 A/G-specific DNA-adenine glycosylase [Nitrospirillum amazonense]
MIVAGDSLPLGADLPAPRPADLLAWYDAHRRVLPWRTAPGGKADPYHVWLSEIMLQQTTVATVGPYFQRFLARWPTVADLAAVDLDEVLKEWAGLGYYARARNLHACAKAVVERHGGRFPADEAALLDLPGIGAYTAAAIAAIAFDRPATAMDGNVERVMSRIYAVTDPLPGSKPKLKALAAALVPEKRPGDYTQALFDLGATLCSPRSPRCVLCPWMAACRGRRDGLAELLPLKAEKAAKPTRRGVAFWLTNAQGLVLLRRRPESGLLGGMMEVPSSAWEPGADLAYTRALGWAPAVADWQRLPGIVRHTFTHFHLELTVVRGHLDDDGAAVAGVWCAPADFHDQALPTVMRKVVAWARGGGAGRGND